MKKWIWSYFPLKIIKQHTHTIKGPTLAMLKGYHPYPLLQKAVLRDSSLIQSHICPLYPLLVACNFLHHPRLFSECWITEYIHRDKSYQKGRALHRSTDLLMKDQIYATVFLALSKAPGQPGCTQPTCIQMSHICPYTADPHTIPIWQRR